MSNPKPRSSSNRGRSVSPSAAAAASSSSRKGRSKSVRKRRSAEGENHDQNGSSRHHHQGGRSGSKSRRGRSKSQHARHRSRSKSVHQRSKSKSHRSSKDDQRSTRDGDKHRSRDRDDRRSRDKDERRSARDKEEHTQRRNRSVQRLLIESDSEPDAEPPRAPPRGMLARTTSRRNLSTADAAATSAPRLRRTKSMDSTADAHAGVLVAEEQDKAKRRARRRLSSFGPSGPASGSDAEGPANTTGAGGRPTLSKELQKRRSQRRLIKEEAQTRERIQNQIFEKALQRTKSMRGLKIEDDDDEEEEDQQDDEPVLQKRPGRRPSMLQSGGPEASRRGGRRSSMSMDAGTSKEASQRGPPRTCSRRGSIDAGAVSWRRGVSSRRLMDAAKDGGAPEGSRRGGRSTHRRASMEMGMKRGPSTRRPSTDHTSDSGDIQRNSTRSGHRRASMGVAMKRSASRKNIVSSDDDMDTPLKRSARSGDRRASMDKGSNRRVKDDEDDSESGSDDEKRMPQSSGHVRRLAPSRKDSCPEASAHRRQSINLLDTFDDDDESFFGESKKNVMASAEAARRLPPKLDSKKPAKSDEEKAKEDEKEDSRGYLNMWAEDDKTVEESMTEEDPTEVHSMTEEEQSMTEFGEVEEEDSRAISKSAALQQMFDRDEHDEDEVSETEETEEDDVFITDRRLPPKKDSKSTVLQKAAQGMALLEQAKAEGKYTLEDSVHSQPQLEGTAASIRARRRNTSLANAIPSSSQRPRLYDKKNRSSQRSRTSLGLLKLGMTDESSCSMSQHTATTVSTSASASQRSHMTRSSSSSHSTSSTEEHARRMKDFSSRFKNNKQNAVARCPHDKGKDGN